MDTQQKIFENRAEPTGKTEKVLCENCSERLVFALRDNYHEFSLGLSTVLECLAFAVQNGDLPKLPMSWFSAVDNSYETEFSLNEDICYYNSEGS